MGLILIPGTCRQCGCTDDDACVDDNDGARCGEENLAAAERVALEDLEQ